MSHRPPLLEKTYELLESFVQPFETVDGVISRAVAALAAASQASQKKKTPESDAVRDFSWDDPPLLTFAKLTRLIVCGAECRPDWITLTDAIIMDAYKAGGLQLVHRLISPKILQGKSPNGRHHYLAACDLFYHGFSAQRSWEAAARVVLQTGMAIDMEFKWTDEGIYPGVTGRLSSPRS